MTDTVCFHFQFITKVKTLNKLNTILLNEFSPVCRPYRLIDFSRNFHLKITINLLIMTMFNHCLTSKSIPKMSKLSKIQCFMHRVSCTLYPILTISKTFVKHLFSQLFVFQSIAMSVRHLYSDRQIC